MTETANERIRIEAPADRCWDVAVDFESYPEWVRDVKDVHTLERDEEGRGRRDVAGHVDLPKVQRRRGLDRHRPRPP